MKIKTHFNCQNREQNHQTFLRLTTTIKWEYPLYYWIDPILEEMIFPAILKDLFETWKIFSHQKNAYQINIDNLNLAGKE